MIQRRRTWLKIVLIAVLFLHIVVVSSGITTVIKIYSIPSGVAVFLEGKDTGEVTPCVIDVEFTYSEGVIVPQLLELRKEGYKNFKQTIEGPENSLIQARLTPI